jgi:hypothetical protein
MFAYQIEKRQRKIKYIIIKLLIYIFILFKFIFDINALEKDFWFYSGYEIASWKRCLWRSLFSSRYI